MYVEGHVAGSSTEGTIPLFVLLRCSATSYIFSSLVPSPRFCDNGKVFLSYCGTSSEFAFLYLVQECLLPYLLYSKSSCVCFLYMTC